MFLTNFLPDARARLRIDVEDIRAANPDVVYVRGSALGNQGPEADKGGYDQPTFWSRSGASAGITPPNVDAALGMPGPAFGDTIGGMTIAGGIAAALFARQRTGETSVLDVSLLGCGVYANALAVDLGLVSGNPWQDPPVSAEVNAAPKNPLVGMFRTADGRYINLNMMQPGRYWADVCAHVGREDLLADERFSSAAALMENSAAAAGILAQELATETYAHWVGRFAGLEGQ